MAKRKSVGPDEEKLLFCAGPEMQGDGTKSTSKCPISDSRKLRAVRYQCHYCSTNTDPNKVIADEKGITEYGKQVYHQHSQDLKKIQEAKIEELKNQSTDALIKIKTRRTPKYLD